MYMHIGNCALNVFMNYVCIFSGSGFGNCVETNESRDVALCKACALCVSR